MSAIAHEHSIHIHIDGLDAMSVSDSSIEFDYMMRAVGYPFDRLACEGWWLWR